MPASPAPENARTPSTRGDLGRSLVALDEGWTMGSELLVGILLLSGLGWLADEALGSTPWLFAIGALAGFGCGLYLVILRAQRMDDREREGRGDDGA
jgi:F0F1-type ATP synthase assembly protein I